LSRDQIILPEHLPVEVRLGGNVRPKREEETPVLAEPVIAAAPDAPLPAAESEMVGEMPSAAHTTLEACDISGMVKALLRESKAGDAYSFVMEQFEKELLRQSLEMHRWNQVQSAAHLGITRNTLRAKIEKYEL